MAKYERNSVGSLVLGHHHPTTTSSSGCIFRLWSLFSTSSFRRKIFEAVSCGGSCRFHDRYDFDLDYITSPAFSAPATEKSTFNEKLKQKQRERQQEEEEKMRKVTALISNTKLKVINGNGNAKTERLADLLDQAEAEIVAETEKKVEALEELKQVVKELQLEDTEKARMAASRVRLMAKEKSDVRETLAMLGAIPPLVGMLDVEDVDSQISSLYALLNLGIKNDANKTAIVKAGAIHKMLRLIESDSSPAQNSSVYEAIAANFLALSALDPNKPIIGSSGAVPFLVKTLQDNEGSSSQAILDALRALYNLSIFPANISFILKTDLVPFLLSTLGDMEVSERILAILSNLASTQEGRRAISIVPDAFPILVDVLNWTDSPRCQEKASYILMVMAHKSYGDRQVMIEAGIASSLLELTLLGTTLAQKRASRLLECLRLDQVEQVSGNYYTSNWVGNVSAPICGPPASSSSNPKESPDDEDMMSAEKIAVKHLVQQSMHKNMERIVKRAKLPQNFVPSDHLKSLTSSTTSKSLPF